MYDASRELTNSSGVKTVVFFMGCAASTDAKPPGPGAKVEARPVATDAAQAADEAVNAEKAPQASLGATAQAAAANIGWASTEVEMHKPCVISAQWCAIVIDGQSFNIPATGPSEFSYIYRVDRGTAPKLLHRVDDQ